MSDDPAGWLAIARQAAVIAGEVVMPLYHEGVAVELKADQTPVTVADRGAEEAMRAFLDRETPGFGIIGEEFGETAGDGRHTWVLDPIDGTKSFVHHVPLFGTLVALLVDGEPVVGVIACHAVGETVSAARGHGAELNGAPARVSDVGQVADATVLVTSSKHLLEREPAGYTRLAAQAGLVRSWGDCYGYLMVATGRAEVMLDREMNLWDVAALVPVITEAGGRLTTWEGRDGIGESAIATNGRVHAEVLALLAG